MGHNKGNIKNKFKVDRLEIVEENSYIEDG